MKTEYETQDLAHLQRRIGYIFTNKSLLKLALTHRSYSQKNNNERLEFIGDAILDYTIAKMLFDAFPKLDEGVLSRLRSNLVNQHVLADIASQLGLGGMLYLGKGEIKNGGIRRPSILSDALEALFAGISLDSNFSEAQRVIEYLFMERVKSIQPDDCHSKDAKSRLQEWLQAQHYDPPKYRILKQVELDGDHFFEIECDLGELGHTFQAEGTSRRIGEQEAASLALNFLLNQKKRKND